MCVGEECICVCGGGCMGGGGGGNVCVGEECICVCVCVVGGVGWG